MRGGMAGVVADGKENMTPVAGEGKKGGERRISSGTGSTRRLSISGSKSHTHCLRAIANRFKRKGGAGRGRIIVQRPLQFDSSPFEFDSRSDKEGDRRRSFVVFEDDADSVSSKSKQLEFATEFGTVRKGRPAARPKSGTLGKCRTLKPGVSGEQTASRESVLEKSKYHSLKSITAFRARAKAMFAASLGPTHVSALVEAANQQESGPRTCLENQPRKWQRGGGARVYSQCSLDTNELEDIEQVFRKMDEEDLQEELHRHELEEEMQKYELEKERLEEDQRQQKELFVSAEVSKGPETVEVHVEEQATLRKLAPERSSNQDLELLSPRIGGLEIDDETRIIELTTPQLRLDQEEPVPKPTPVILELGVSPKAFESDRASKQVTPPVRLPFSGCNSQDLETLQRNPEDFESQLAQTVKDVLVWSVELDPSRRRREFMENYRNCRSPLLERPVYSPFRSANQFPDSAYDSLRKSAQLNVGMPLSSLEFSELDMNEPARSLVEAYEVGFRSTCLPSSSGKGQSGKWEDVEITDRRLSTCPDQATINGDKMHIALVENEREMQAWMDKKVTLGSSWSSWADQSPARHIDLSIQCMDDLREKTSESSLESPSLQAAEFSRRVESATATTPLVQPSFETIRMSPTPPRDLSLYLGNPFGQMNSEELSRRWVQFCTSPSVFLDGKVQNKRSWIPVVESTFTEPTCLDPTSSFPSEQVLQGTNDGDALPNTEEEAVSSDGFDWKASTHDEDVLPSAGEEALSSDALPNTEEEAVSSDGLDWKTSMHDEDVLPSAGEEALSSDGSDGVMDYENDFDNISNDTTQIIQTGASSAYTDQEGTSALKERPEEDVPLGEDVFFPNLTPLRDKRLVAALIEPAVEYSLTHPDEEHIDQFMSSLQVTPAVDESCVDRPSINGEDVSKVNYNDYSPAEKAGHLSVIKEVITPGKDVSKSSPQAQDGSTPVQKQTKKKRTRKSTRTVKVDSPLDAGSKWSNGKRQSTRIKSKPLDWWRGERMLYGRVHSSLNTLIGIKHLSPDPVWPRPRTGERKSKVAPQKFKVDSFVSDEHNELLRLAAQ